MIFTANSISRRNFLAGLLAIPLASVNLGCSEPHKERTRQTLVHDGDRTTHPAERSYDTLLAKWFSESRVAGVQACVIENGNAVWHKVLGWADIANHVPMSADTVMNVASISKTVTAAAIMQLAEQGRLSLDQDINRYLSFPVHNPFHSAESITVRHLLTHTSTIQDGPAYSGSYSCGRVSELAAWVREYLSPRGTLYSRDNFHPWAPGKQFAYSNVAFGLLGCIVETVSAASFPDYCARYIFGPLGMASTSFGSAVGTSRQAVPYTLFADGRFQGRVLTNGKPAPVIQNGAFYAANCLYSFPTTPDGLLRTTARDFAKFLSAMLREGQSDRFQLLHPDTVEETFRSQYADAVRPSAWPASQGMAWYAQLISGHAIWQHSGADPGINTIVLLHLPTKSATLFFVNTTPTEHLGDVAGACLELAAKSGQVQKR